MIESEPRGGIECTARERVYELESSARVPPLSRRARNRTTGLLGDVLCNYDIVIALGGVQRATPVVITFFQYASTGKIFLV